ncbi:T9SS type A sorting domain-containing protein [Bacteroidota bacterium]
MIRKTLNIIFLFLIITNVECSYAQISQGGKPYSFNNTLKSNMVIQEIPGLDQQELQRIEDTENNRKLKPYRFAAEIPVNINSKNSGIWEILPDGSRLWRHAIKSEGALSLNVIFSKYRLPEGGRLFLYNPDRSMVLGAFTGINNKESGILAIIPVIGDELILEYIEPENAEFQAELEINQLGYDYKGFYRLMEKSSHYGRSGECNIDVNCPEGENWQAEKRSVCKIIINGYKLGSGALVNNTSANGDPLFLTANHVISTLSEASSTIFIFNYESPECDGPDGSGMQSLSGSTILATTRKLDFCLLRLSSVPPEEYLPYYAGWDNSGTYPKKGICIHHPRGDVKKISFDDDQVITGNYGSNFDYNSHWRILEWDRGTTEGGSSGSPLFNEYHEIVGCLTGGDASCTYNKDDFFWKLSRSWDDYSDPAQQLKVWLDPENTGETKVSGLDPYSVVNIFADFSWSPLEVEVNRELVFTELSFGSPNEWRWEFPDGQPSFSDQKEPEKVMFTTAGIKDVRLIIKKESETDTIIKKIRVKNTVGFVSDFTRIVSGGKVNFTDVSSGEPSGWEWNFENGDPEISYKEHPTVRYSDPGTNRVTLKVTYNDDSISKSVDNYVEVLNERIILNCNFLSNIGSNEHTGVDSIKVLSGYIPGINSDNNMAYAERFVNSSGKQKEINRLFVTVAKSAFGSPSSFIRFKVWGKEFNILGARDYNLNTLNAGSELVIDFPLPVKIDSVFYVGFELNYMTFYDAFAVPMALNRSDTDENTLFVQDEEGKWDPITESYYINSSMAIKPELCTTDITFEDNIRIYPNPTNGSLTIDFGEIIFNNFDFEILDMQGKQIEFVENFDYGKVNVDISSANSGLYIVKIKVDDFIVMKKIIKVK